jgi:hypothetical protein
MIKTISCDPYWNIKKIKIAIKTSLELFLNNMREQRIFNLGESTNFNDTSPNILQISAGASFSGLAKIIQGPEERYLVEIQYDENSYMNKSLWEGYFNTLEEQLIKPLE